MSDRYRWLTVEQNYTYVAKVDRRHSHPLHFCFVPRTLLPLELKLFVSPILFRKAFPVISLILVLGLSTQNLVTFYSGSAVALPAGTAEPITVTLILVERLIRFWILTARTAFHQHPPVLSWREFRRSRLTKLLQKPQHLDPLSIQTQSS